MAEPRKILLDQHGKEIDLTRRHADDGMALPHVVTYASILQGAYHTYFHQWDEAMRHSRENALAMRRDLWLMALLRERIEGTISLKWHLEPDNKRDPWQRAVAAGLKHIVEATPRLRRMQRYLMQSLWYGRYGSQVKWDWAEMELPVPSVGSSAVPGSGGDSRKMKALVVKKHIPVNGDKISYFHDHETPYVLVNSAATSDLEGAEVISTSRGTAVALSGEWRERFIIATTNVDDADYFEAEMAAGIGGVGLRSILYWTYWLKTEYFSWITDAMERLGLGLVCIEYDASNKEAEEQAKQIAKTYGRKSVFVVPATKDSREKGGAVRVIEAPTAGAQIVLKLIDHLEAKTERFIIGQTLSAGTEGSGLGGSGVAGMHARTKFNLVSSDAHELAETLTGGGLEPGLISIIKKYSYPWADFPVRWAYEMEDPESERKMGAASMFVNMGGELIKDEARSITGMSAPSPDDEVISLAAMQEAAAQQQAQMGGGQPGQPAQPGQPQELGAGQEAFVPEPGAGGAAGMQGMEPLGRQGELWRYLGPERRPLRYAQKVVPATELAPTAAQHDPLSAAATRPPGTLPRSEVGKMPQVMAPGVKPQQPPQQTAFGLPPGHSTQREGMLPTGPGVAPREPSPPSAQDLTALTDALRYGPNQGGHLVASDAYEEAGLRRSAQALRGQLGRMQYPVVIAGGRVFTVHKQQVSGEPGSYSLFDVDGQQSYPFAVHPSPGQTRAGNLVADLADDYSAALWDNSHKRLEPDAFGHHVHVLLPGEIDQLRIPHGLDNLLPSGQQPEQHSQPGQPTRYQNAGQPPTSARPDPPPRASRPTQLMPGNPWEGRPVPRPTQLQTHGPAPVAPGMARRAAAQVPLAQMNPGQLNPQPPGQQPPVAPPVAFPPAQHGGGYDAEYDPGEYLQGGDDQVEPYDPDDQVVLGPADYNDDDLVFDEPQQPEVIQPADHDDQTEPPWSGVGHDPELHNADVWVETHERQLVEPIHHGLRDRGVDLPWNQAALARPVMAEVYRDWQRHLNTPQGPTAPMGASSQAEFERSFEGTLNRLFPPDQHPGDRELVRRLEDSHLHETSHLRRAARDAKVFPAQQLATAPRQVFEMARQARQQPEQFEQAARHFNLGAGFDAKAFDWVRDNQRGLGQNTGHAWQTLGREILRRVSLFRALPQSIKERMKGGFSPSLFDWGELSLEDRHQLQDWYQDYAGLAGDRPGMDTPMSQRVTQALWHILPVARRYAQTARERLARQGRAERYAENLGHLGGEESSPPDPLSAQATRPPGTLPKSSVGKFPQAPAAARPVAEAAPRPQPDFGLPVVQPGQRPPSMPSGVYPQKSPPTPPTMHDLEALTAKPGLDPRWHMVASDAYEDAGLSRSAQALRGVPQKFGSHFHTSQAPVLLAGGRVYQVIDKHAAVPNTEGRGIMLLDVETGREHHDLTEFNHEGMTYQQYRQERERRGNAATLLHGMTRKLSGGYLDKMRALLDEQTHTYPSTPDSLARGKRLLDHLASEEHLLPTAGFGTHIYSITPEQAQLFGIPYGLEGLQHQQPAQQYAREGPTSFEHPGSFAPEGEGVDYPSNYPPAPGPLRPPQPPQLQRRQVQPQPPAMPGQPPAMPGQQPMQQPQQGTQPDWSKQAPGDPTKAPDAWSKEKEQDRESSESNFSAEELAHLQKALAEVFGGHQP